MPFLSRWRVEGHGLFVTREEGQGAVQYALLLMLMAIVVIGVLHLSDVALPFQLPDIQLPIGDVGQALAGLFEGIRLP